MSHLDTIYAPATLIGPAGLSVFRVSGSKAFDVLKALSRLDNTKINSHRAVLTKLYNPETKNKVDEALILPFKGPNSFTGEDVVEFHLHGGHAVANAFIKALQTISGLRMAEPGEFTKRAFENDRIDLTQAEAIADLIHASTEAQHLLALNQLDGNLAKLYMDWALNLKNILAYVEADIDFSDEDVPDELSSVMRPKIEDLILNINKHLDDNNRGERLRDGLRIAIIGAPNAGKSSLINKLAKRDVAIVNERAGTTRDIVEVALNINGFPVIIADTAGLRLTDDEIEEEGISRAKKWAETADFKIALFDSSKVPDVETVSMLDNETIILSTKTDLSPALNIVNGTKAHAFSTNNEDDLSKLLSVLEEKAKTFFGFSINDNVSRETKNQTLITRQRHRILVEETKEHLSRSLSAPSVDMMAEDVRLAIRSLGKITGQIDVEDLLDVIFNDFCIGK